MSDTTTCPQCGAAISGESTENLCPGCLLKSANNDSSASAAFEQTYVTPTAGKQGFQAPPASELDALFPTSSFDAVVCIDAAYHARALAAFIAAAESVLSIFANLVPRPAESLTCTVRPAATAGSVR